MKIKNVIGVFKYESGQDEIVVFASKDKFKDERAPHLTSEKKCLFLYTFLKKRFSKKDSFKKGIVYVYRNKQINDLKAINKLICEKGIVDKFIAGNNILVIDSYNVFSYKKSPVKFLSLEVPLNDIEVSNNLEYLEYKDIDYKDTLIILNDVRGGIDDLIIKSGSLKLSHCNVYIEHSTIENLEIACNNQTLNVLNSWLCSTTYLRRLGISGTVNDIFSITNCRITLSPNFNNVNVYNSIMIDNCFIDICDNVLNNFIMIGTKLYNFSAKNVFKTDKNKVFKLYSLADTFNNLFIETYPIIVNNKPQDCDILYYKETENIIKVGVRYNSIWYSLDDFFVFVENEGIINMSKQDINNHINYINDMIKGGKK